MGSPLRIFRHLTTVQIQSLIASGFDRALYGTFSSVSGSSKSGSLENLSLEALLFEASAELDIRNGTRRMQKVEQRIFE